MYTGDSFILSPFLFILLHYYPACREEGIIYQSEQLMRFKISGGKRSIVLEKLLQKKTGQWKLKEGDIFTCKILKTAMQENCMSCEAFMETPDLKKEQYRLCNSLFQYPYLSGKLNNTQMNDCYQIKSPVELELMRGLKRMLDPKGILSPGRLLPHA